MGSILIDLTCTAGCIHVLRRVGAVKDCAMFIACVSDNYFTKGSNAQLEYIEALRLKNPGINMIAIKMPGQSASAMRKVVKKMPLGAIFDLSCSGESLKVAVKKMVNDVPGFNSTKRAYRSSGSQIEEVYTTSTGRVSYSFCTPRRIAHP